MTMGKTENLTRCVTGLVQPTLIEASMQPCDQQ